MPLWAILNATVIRLYSHANPCVCVPQGFESCYFQLFISIMNFHLSSQHPASHNRGASPRVWVAQDSICRWHPIQLLAYGCFFLGKVCTGFCINWHCSENKIILFCITCMEVILCLRSDSGKGCAVTRAGNQKVVGSNVLFKSLWALGSMIFFIYFLFCNTLE